MTEFEAIKFLVEKEFQVEMDGEIFIQMLGPMAGDQAGYFHVAYTTDPEEWIYRNVDDAVNKFLVLKND